MIACKLQGTYRKWWTSVHFKSMVAGDIQACKNEVAKTNQTLEKHLVEKKMSECVNPYSDKLFMQVAIEWLVATDQVSKCAEVRHPLKLILFVIADSST